VAISVMNWVWTHSRSRHGARLTLLAIADCASGDGGNAWPSVAEIKRKAGLSERAVHSALADLVKLGELEIQYNAGPKGCNRYRVVMTCTPAESAPPQNLHPADTAPPQDTQGSESSQATTQTPAESAPPADSAPPQNPQPPPAESADGTVNEPKPKNSPSESSSDTPEPKPARRKRAARPATYIPDDFAVTAEMIQWALREVPTVDWRYQTKKFIDHWRQTSGSNARKSDWEAAWRNWLRRADEEAPSNNGHRQQKPSDHRREWERNRS
jgi:hypothetical protein